MSSQDRAAENLAINNPAFQARCECGCGAFVLDGERIVAQREAHCARLTAKRRDKDRRRDAAAMAWWTIPDIAGALEMSEGAVRRCLRGHRVVRRRLVVRDADTAFLWSGRGRGLPFEYRRRDLPAELRLPLHRYVRNWCLPISEQEARELRAKGLL